MSVAIPKLAVVLGSVTPPQGDVLEARVSLGATKEVSSWELLLQNWDKKYSPGGTYPILVGQSGHIDIGRGVNVPQIISTRTEKIKYESTSSEHYLRVSGRCLGGEKLFRRQVTKTYYSQKGEDIVKDLLDNYAGVSRTRTVLLTQDGEYGQPYVYISSADVYKFSVGQSVTIADSQNSENNIIADKGSNWLQMQNPLAHTYYVAYGANVNYSTVENTDTTFSKLEYEDTPVWDILRFIAASADKSGVIGYDFRVAPDGVLDFFPINTKTSSVSLSEKIEYSEYSKDIFRVRNKIRICGGQGKHFPSNLDSWSESLDGWTCDGGTMALNNTQERKGTYCLQVNTPGGGGIASVYRTFDALVKPQTFVVWARMPGNLGGGYAYVRLAAPDWSNYFQADIKSFLEGNCINTWALLSLALGRGNMYDADHNPNGAWTVGAGNPQWNKISGLKLIANCVGATSYFLWDGDFGFPNCAFSAVAEDSASQNAYGLREFPDTDEELASDNECMLRANALRAHLKDPAEYLTVRSTVIDYGNSPLLPADKINVVLPNENVNADFRILSPVEYYVNAKTQTLEITLQLGREVPLLADYIYALRSKTDHLSRHKIAR